VNGIRRPVENREMIAGDIYSLVLSLNFLICPLSFHQISRELREGERRTKDTRVVEINPSDPAKS